jgi:ABC-type nitrate/sulfonate/bicarbonate transport system permease component
MKIKVNEKQTIEMGVILGGIFLVISMVTKMPVFQTISLATLLISLIVPRVFYPLALLWFGLSQAMGNLVSKVILAAVFFLVVLPVGLVLRLVKHDPLKLRQFKGNQSSAFQNRNHLYQSNELFNQY